MKKVLQVNRTIIKIVVICVLILLAIGSKVNITAIEAQKTEVLASEIEETSRVTWVDSTELDEKGQAKQVPVPKGFTSSQIEGEIITVEENDIINKTTTIDDTISTKEIEQNFYEMIKSIKKYGGFYIGRYETGSLNGTAVVRKMDTNIAKQTWYTMYNKCKQLGASNDNLATSMICGSLWDATL